MKFLDNAFPDSGVQLLKSKMSGVFAAMPTPMTAEHEVDLGPLEELTEYLIDSGVQGLVPLGSTGEFYALSASERQNIVRTVIDVSANRVPVIVGANAGSTRDVVEYCRDAAELGASGVLLAAPYYSIPTASELVNHFEAIACSISIPIMLYNYPARTGVDLTPDLVERLAKIDGVDYIKESSGDATRVSDILSRCENNMTVFCGSDTLALESFASGAKGWVGGIVNLLPREHQKLFELATSGRLDEARDLYYRLMPLLQLFESGGQYTQLVKLGCKIRGLNLGPPRAPLAVPAASTSKKLKDRLHRFLGPEAAASECQHP